MAMVVLIAGCASQNRGQGIVFSPDTHLIFNPEWTGISTLEEPRTPWPMTTVYPLPGEKIEFRETIIDYDGQLGYQSGRTYRRFHATRRGFRSRWIIPKGPNKPLFMNLRIQFSGCAWISLIDGTLCISMTYVRFARTEAARDLLSHLILCMISTWNMFELFYLPLPNLVVD